MVVKLDFDKLRASRQASWLALDLFMVVLVSVNLVFIVFDTLYAAADMQALLAKVAPDLDHFYRERIHAHFLFYDLIFVSIFLAEFFFQWVMAVRRELYPRWYFYPFAHWYDLLGCIPLGSFRALRLLRIASLLVRLQKMGVIDLTDTAIYRFFAFYFDAFIEQVTDRVMIRTLDDIRREVEHESPIAREIITDVVAPQREALVRHLSRRIGRVAQQSYENHHDAIRHYADSVIRDAIGKDRNIRNLERVPLIGRSVVENLRESINDIVHEIFDRTVRDISTAENNRLVDEAVTVIIDAILEEHATEGEPEELGDLGTRITVEAIEVIKERIRVQHWKQRLDETPPAAASEPA
ncbi:MAG: hypothetical protein RQ847_12425 [Wenzhouxiangellaceae bacterium]|nr:hypothetical protein [Wenzhouxiangellaceae bacterium]